MNVIDRAHPVGVTLSVQPLLLLLQVALSTRFPPIHGSAITGNRMFGLDVSTCCVIVDPDIVYEVGTL